MIKNNSNQQEIKEYKIDEEYSFKYNEIEDEWDRLKDNKLIPIKSGKLFKYYSGNINNIDALMTSYIYLSNPASFNDPFDCNVSVVPGIDDNLKISNESHNKNNLENIGISCFCEEIDNPLMWAHYTNNYHGFSLEFENNNLKAYPNHNQIIRSSFTKVIYLKKLVKIPSNAPFATHYMLSTKHKHWEYENEWRMICHIGNNKQDRYLRFDPLSVKAIYIGHKLIEENSSEMRLILYAHMMFYKHCKMYVVYPDYNNFKIVYKDFKDVFKNDFPSKTI